MIYRKLISKIVLLAITELGKRGILTIRYDNPRVGPTMVTMYAYTLEGDHLKRSEIVRYPDTEVPDPLYIKYDNKYLADGKRAVITPIEITP